MTGCYRSGTTLLEKLLHMHPQVVVGSQPFPVLYFLLKELFLEERGLERRYPLGHLFREDGYEPSDFYAFLDRRRLTHRDLVAFFRRMEAYVDGLWTPEVLRSRDRLRPGTFREVYRQLLGFLAELFPKSRARYLGSKEVLIEEFVPYLLSRGTTVILVLRDPRAVISSLNFRHRENLTGGNRPILYSLRAWRKSVAIAFGCEGEPGFHWLRYEDLVRGLGDTLDELAAFLGVPPYPADALAEGVLDQHGKPWRGNSSFRDLRGISTAPVRSFERRLPGEVLEYVETICYPEMRALGYRPLVADTFDAGVLARFREPFAAVHDKFPHDYSSAPERVTEERQRYAKLSGEPPAPEVIRSWFVNAAAYRKLRAASGRAPSHE